MKEGGCWFYFSSSHKKRPLTITNVFVAWVVAWVEVLEHGAERRGGMRCGINSMCVVGSY
jgi:hypothetical protein